MSAPSIDQCPVLCGRIANSLTSTSSPVSNNSTASIPSTPRAAATSSATRCARADRSGFNSGAGATTSLQMPFTCSDSTTGYATACPCGDRATCADNSRTNSTFSSTSQRAPGLSVVAAITCAASACEPTTHTPRPS